MFLEMTVASALTTLGWVYVGYPLSLTLWAPPRPQVAPLASEALPALTLIIPAWNEKELLPDKVKNTLKLNYPPELLDVIWVTDGSDDDSEALLASLGQFVMHQPERRGKAAAINRAMNVAQGDVVVFTDANTHLETDTLRAIAQAFSDSTVGCVSGCKKVITNGFSSGEGLYWRYEDMIKRWETRHHSTMGAPGELVAFQRPCLRQLDESVILDDFILSMDVIRQGKRLVYVPDAIAVELPSANAGADLERRARIAAGGLQSLLQLSELLNPRQHPMVAYMLFSHRLLRWTVAPLATFILPVALFALAIANGGLWTAAAQVQGLALLLAALQAVFGFRRGPQRFVHFFYLANAAAILGWLRFVRRSQSSTWTRVERAKANTAPTWRTS